MEIPRLALLARDDSYIESLRFRGKARDRVDRQDSVAGAGAARRGGDSMARRAVPPLPLPLPLLQIDHQRGQIRGADAADAAGLAEVLRPDLL